MRNYEDVAAGLSIVLCGACDIVSVARHRDGFAAANTVHWAPRRLTRAGLRRFLMLVARIRVHNYLAHNKAMRIYMENAWSTRAAAALKVRFDRALSSQDRLMVRWLASTGSTITPSARRWADRKETTSVKFS